MAGDPRSHRRYRTVALVVVKQEPTCWLRFAGICTGRSTTADHVIPVKQCIAMGRNDLVFARSNLRGACAACNNHRKARSVEQIGHLMGGADEVTSWAL